MPENRAQRVAVPNIARLVEECDYHERTRKGAVAAEREACAGIAETEAATCGCGTRIAAKIRDRQVSDNEVLRNCE